MSTERETMRLYAAEQAAYAALREVLESGTFGLEEGLRRARAFTAAYYACNGSALASVES